MRSRAGAVRRVAGRWWRYTAGPTSARLTPEERAALRERAEELEAAARPRRKGAADEEGVLAALAAMPAPDRVLGKRVHALVRAAAPHLAPTLRYGMPAYAKEGRVVCFFQGAAKFETCYATLGFSDEAALDGGLMWPTSFALRELTAVEEQRIGELLWRAAG